MTPINKMKKHCRACGKEIKGKPQIFDDYYFCQNNVCVFSYEHTGEVLK